MDAYAKSKTPPEDKDKRQTPISVFNRIQELVNIPLIHDVAAEDHTAKCPSFWTIEDDALSRDWTEASIGYFNNHALWMNPPYSNPEAWVKKAAEEARNGLIVVGLIPDDRSTGWWQKWVEDKASIVYIPNKRISFEDGNGVAQKGNPKGSAIPVWLPMECDKTNYQRFIL